MQFTVKATFNTTAEKIYNAWLSSEGHSDMTGGEAEITNKAGDEFSAWDEYITGKNLELTPCVRILQSWRTTEFQEDEADSLLEILLTEGDGKTVITLNHSNLPAHGEQYKKGWEDHYFQPMKAYFS
jgi:activator of HSP90 ATPase